jgi:hypothetical protein
MCLERQREGRRPPTACRGSRSFSPKGRAAGEIQWTIFSSRTDRQLLRESLLSAVRRLTGGSCGMPRKSAFLWRRRWTGAERLLFVKCLHRRGLVRQLHAGPGREVLNVVLQVIGAWQRLPANVNLTAGTGGYPETSGAAEASGEQSRTCSQHPYLRQSAWPCQLPGLFLVASGIPVKFGTIVIVYLRPQV